MTDLPVCRLCNKPARSSYYEDEFLYSCSRKSCSLHRCWMPEKDWRKLMYVPIKKIHTRRDNTGSYGHTYKTGYNAAIDDMLRGGE